MRGAYKSPFKLFVVLTHTFLVVFHAASCLWNGKFGTKILNFVL